MPDVLARFLLRSGASTLWASVNPVLLAGEPGYETDTQKLRIGDGTTTFTSLPFFLNTFSNPALETFAPGDFIEADNIFYTGDLNDVTGRKFMSMGTGITNGPIGAGPNDLMLHFDFSSSDALQEFYNSESPYAVYRRTKIAGTWQPWTTEVQMSGNQSVEGNKTFTGDTTIANLLTSILKGGYTTTAVDDGTKTTGTYTPDPLAATPGNVRRIIANGAFSLAAPTRAGDYSMEVLITNGAAAGAITLAGFTKTNGDAFTTTNTHKFKVFISKTFGITSATVMAMQ